MPELVRHTKYWVWLGQLQVASLVRFSKVEEFGSTVTRVEKKGKGGGWKPEKREGKKKKKKEDERVRERDLLPP